MGACLADDMGLGKTLQILALPLIHARTTLQTRARGRAHLGVRQLGARDAAFRSDLDPRRVRRQGSASRRSRTSRKDGRQQGRHLDQLRLATTRRSGNSRDAPVGDGRARRSAVHQELRVPPRARSVRTGRQAATHRGHRDPDRESFQRSSGACFASTTPGSPRRRLTASSTGAFVRPVERDGSTRSERRLFVRMVKPYVLRRLKTDVAVPISRQSPSCGTSPSPLRRRGAALRPPPQTDSPGSSSRGERQAPTTSSRSSPRSPASGRFCCHPEARVPRRRSATSSKVQRILELVEELSRKWAPQRFVFSQYVELPGDPRARRSSHERGISLRIRWAALTPQAQSSGARSTFQNGSAPSSSSA